jgi:hypothetical protein
MISRKRINGGMPPKKTSKKRNRCSKIPDKSNRKILNNILNNLCVEDIRKNPTYMGIWTDVTARFDDTCLAKLSRMSSKDLETYGISKDVYQFGQTQSDATRFRKACREALASSNL